MSVVREILRLIFLIFNLCVLSVSILTLERYKVLSRHKKLPESMDNPQAYWARIGMVVIGILAEVFVILGWIREKNGLFHPYYQLLLNSNI